MLEIACVKEDNIEYILLMIMDSFLVQDSVHGMVYKSALSAYHITGHQLLTLNPTPLLKKRFQFTSSFVQHTHVIVMNHALQLVHSLIPFMFTQSVMYQQQTVTFDPLTSQVNQLTHPSSSRITDCSVQSSLFFS